MNDALAFVRAALPAPPARVLEVGAGDGELAASLTDLGYAVTEIDPDPQAAHVRPVALHELREPPDSFDAAVAVLSLHHVEPLAESCRVLGDLIRPGGWIVIDKFDVERLDERAAQWLLVQHAAIGDRHEHDPAAMVEEYRDHLHPLERVRQELSPYFDLGEPVRGAYVGRRAA